MLGGNSKNWGISCIPGGPQKPTYLSAKEKRKQNDSKYHLYGHVLLLKVRPRIFGSLYDLRGRIAGRAFTVNSALGVMAL